MKTALTIAGSDSSGGAGIQADIKTMSAHGIYAMSAITALTAQNTTGVYGILESDPDFLANQLDCIFTDIYPDAVKIGMVSSAALIEVIAQKLKQYHAKNIVVDPVMVATSGSRLIAEDAVEALKQNLRIWKQQQNRSARSMAVRFCAKADTISTMPMIFFGRTAAAGGFMENESTIRTPMAPDAPSPARLLRTLQKE